MGVKKRKQSNAAAEQYVSDPPPPGRRSRAVHPPHKGEGKPAANSALYDDATHNRVAIVTARIRDAAAKTKIQMR